MTNYTAPYEPQSTRRLHLLARILYSLALVIFGRLLYLQIFKHAELKELAIRQQEQKIDLREMRGTIFDADMKPLAISVPVESVCVNPMRIKDPGFAAAILTGALKLEEGEAHLRERIEVAKQSKNGWGFLWIKRKLTPEESESIHMLRDRRRDKNIESGAGLDWIEFRTESKRVYPNGALAGNIIGWLNEREKGAYGLEHTLDDQLESVRGVARVIKDVRPTETQGAFGQIVSVPAIPGKNIVITIDARIQYAAEQSLARAVQRTKAAHGAVVVLDPKNGHILAMASYPSFDPNKVPDKPELWRNYAISGYEPGSAFKVVTYSSVFEHTKLSPRSPINCNNGSLSLFGHTFRDTHSMSVIPIEDAFAQSSNVAAILAGRQVGEDGLFDMIQKFGFGRKTKIPLDFEESGYVPKVQQWRKSKITLASASIGYGIRTTTLQLAQAAAVIANGGSLVAPQLVISTQRPGEPVEKVKAPDPVRIMRPETAFTMRKLMEHVILTGTGKKAFLKTYTAGGKTGSSKTTTDLNLGTYVKKDGTVGIKKKTVYTANTYNGTFYGMAPLVDPSVAIAVTISGGHGLGGFGGEAAAPVFREVALAALRLRDVPKDVPLDSPAAGEDSSDLAIASVEPAPSDDNDFVFASVPLPQASSAATAEAGGLRLFSKTTQEDEDPDQPRGESATGPVVPNFQGKTLRAVLEQASGIGLDIEPLGRGVARSQIPAPGQRIAPGEKVKVQFAR